MSTEWCPYTGKLHPPDEMTEDHVIPLSLGGHNGLTIRASREGNAHVNRLLDEPIAKHPFVANMRRVRGLTGRRGKLPVVKWPSAVGNIPAVVNWSSPKLELETFRGTAPYGINLRRALHPGEQFKSEISFSADQFLSFGCRLALGAAHHLFGETFRLHGYHDELRALMNSPTSLKDLQFGLANARGSGFFWALSWPRRADELEPLWPALCQRTDGHLVFAEHTVRELILGVSLFGGFFQWYFNITKDSRAFPIGGDFELGAVVEMSLSPPSYRRTDLRSHLETTFRDLMPVVPGR